MAAPREVEDIRLGLIACYEQLAEQYAGSPHRSWTDRLEAVREGDTLVEPGWLLRPLVGDVVDTYGLYRVYRDGRIERDRYLERAEHARFHRSQRDS